MKVLVLFAAVVVGCGLAGARIVTKCELRQNLTTAFSSLPNNVTVNGLNETSFVAKVVCHVDHVSHFNTSAVTKLRQETGKQGKEDSEELGESGPNSKEKGKPPKRKHRSTRGQSKKEDVYLTLYGLFQLPEGLVCSSGNTTSPNMCGISCSKLMDDDISDDINCVVKLIDELITKGFKSPNSGELWKVVKVLVEDNCKNPDQYFTGC